MESVSRLRAAYLSEVVALWILMLVAGLLPCRPADSNTSSGASAHFLLWVVIGVLALPGVAKRFWHVPANWFQRIMAAGVANACVDVIILYIVVVCGFRVSLDQLNPAVKLFFSAVSIVLLLTPPFMVVGLLTAVFGRADGPYSGDAG